MLMYYCDTIFYLNGNISIKAIRTSFPRHTNKTLIVL